MNRHFNEPEARAEWSERFGEPQQQGFHETYMRPQPCVRPDRTDDKDGLDGPDGCDLTPNKGD